MPTLSPAQVPALLEQALSVPSPSTGTAAKVMVLAVPGRPALNATSELMAASGLRRLGTAGSFYVGPGMIYAAGTTEQWRAAAERWSKPPRKQVPFTDLTRSAGTIRTDGIEAASEFDSPEGQAWAVTVHPDPTCGTGPASDEVLRAIDSRAIELGGEPARRDGLRLGSSLTYFPVRLPNMAAVEELAKMDTIRRLEPVARISVRACGVGPGR